MALTWSILLASLALAIIECLRHTDLGTVDGSSSLDRSSSVDVLPPTLSITHGNGTGCIQSEESCITSLNFPSNYDIDQGCTMTGNGIYIHFESFSTEGHYDTMTWIDQPTDNNKVISGTYNDGFSGVLRGNLEWSSDYSVTRSGWKVCPQSNPEGSTVSHQGTPDARYLTIHGTGCRYEDQSEDSCITSNNFLNSSYGFLEHCVIEGNGMNGVYIRVDSFKTESEFDTMTWIDQPMKNKVFSGTLNDGFSGLLRGNITWSSDYLFGDEGWKICPEPPAPARNLMITWGAGCQYESDDGDSCITSLNYPNHYGNHDHCVIEGSGVWISSTNWSTKVADTMTWSDSVAEVSQEYRSKEVSKGEADTHLELLGLLDGTLEWQSHSARISLKNYYTDLGWRVCPQPVPPPRNLMITQGTGCVYEDQKEDSCITSLNYPAPYGTKERCFIQGNGVWFHGNINTMSKSELLWNDTVYVGDKKTSQDKELQDYLGGTLRWDSGPLTSNQKGFKICPGKAS